MSSEVQPQILSNLDIENIVGRATDTDTARTSGFAARDFQSQPSTAPCPARPDPLSPLVALLAHRAALRYRRHRGLSLLQTAVVLAVAAAVLAVLFLTMGGIKP